MPPTPQQITEEQFWAWLATIPLDPHFYGQITLTVRAGVVAEVEQRQTFRKPPRQQGGLTRQPEE